MGGGKDGVFWRELLKNLLVLQWRHIGLCYTSRYSWFQLYFLTYHRINLFRTSSSGASSVFIVTLIRIHLTWSHDIHFGQGGLTVKECDIIISELPLNTNDVFDSRVHGKDVGEKRLDIICLWLVGFQNNNRSQLKWVSHNDCFCLSISWDTTRGSVLEMLRCRLVC